MPRLTDEQIALRRKGIGGSDMGQIFGTEKWHVGAVARVIDDKAHGISAFDDENLSLNESADWGHRLEGVVRDWMREKILRTDGGMIFEPDPNEPEEYFNFSHKTLICRHGTIWSDEPGFEWAYCSPDGLGFTPEFSFGYEGKTRSEFSKSKYPAMGLEEFVVIDSVGQLPMDLYAQVQWSMFVTGLSVWLVGVLIGGNKGRAYKVLRNNAFIEELKVVARQVQDEIESTRAGNSTTFTEPDYVTE